MTKTSKGVQYIVMAALAAITILVVFNAQLGVLQWLTNYSVQIMLAMLGIGLLFFLFRRTRLMFTAFICCGLLCMFLQRSANRNVVLPAYSSGTVFKIAHANLTNVTIDMQDALEAIYSSDADLISLQEVNFKLNDDIQAMFAERYPYQSSPMKNNDFWSINVFSKKPISTLDTFYVGDIPNLHGVLSLDQDHPPIQFVSSYILPPFSSVGGSADFQNHLDQIASTRTAETVPYFVFGNFNVAGWYDEIHDFKEAAGLMDSRRGYMPAVSSPFSYPVDHIFFSEQLKCVDFDLIKTETSSAIGIVGTYQFNDSFLTQESE